MAPSTRFPAFLAAFFVVWALRATVFIGVDEAIATPLGRALYSNVVKFALWVVPAVAYVRWELGLPPARALGISAWPGARRWMSCLAVIAAYFTLVTALEALSGSRRVAVGALASMTAPVFFLQHLVAPWIEEVFFRGLVMRELLTRASLPRASLLTSLLFVGVHLPYWLTHGGLSAALAANSAGVFLFSLLACWLYARSASVWPPTVAHVVNNLVAAMLAGGRA